MKKLFALFIATLLTLGSGVSSGVDREPQKVKTVRAKTTAVQAEAPVNLKRLDPHGLRNFDFKSVVSLTGHSECSTCHTDGGAKLQLKPHVEQICFNCHNKATHSGVAEHMGRPYKGEEITCLSCHSAHRAEARTWESPSGFFGGKFDVQPGSQFQVTSKKETMIRRTCTECHQWR